MVKALIGELLVMVNQWLIYALEENKVDLY
jgi:hypothetical protein